MVETAMFVGSCRGIESFHGFFRRCEMDFVQPLSQTRFGWGAKAEVAMALSVVHVPTRFPSQRQVTLWFFGATATQRP